MPSSAASFKKELPGRADPREAADRSLAARREQLARALAALDPAERATFAQLTEKVLTAFVEHARHACSVCRLCGTQACADCPVDEVSAAGTVVRLLEGGAP